MAGKRQQITLQMGLDFVRMGQTQHIKVWGRQAAFKEISNQTLRVLNHETGVHDSDLPVTALRLQIFDAKAVGIKIVPSVRANMQSHAGGNFVSFAVKQMGRNKNDMVKQRNQALQDRKRIAAQFPVFVEMSDDQALAMHFQLFDGLVERIEHLFNQMITALKFVQN